MTTHNTADGFVTAEDTEFMGRVAERLNAIDPSLHAIVQHTGGGISCIELQLNRGDQYMYWGTAGDTWGGDLNDRDGNYLDESPLSDVSVSNTSPDEVADAIYEIVHRYQR